MYRSGASGKVREGPAVESSNYLERKERYYMKQEDIDFLTPCSEGLDLSITEDRAIFRARVYKYTTAMRVDVLAQMLVQPSPNNRYKVCRRLADAYIDVVM